MSGNAFKKFGICSLEENPTAGVLEKITPNSYRETKRKLETVLLQFCSQLFWTAGASGAWNTEHPYYRDPPARVVSNDIDVWIDATDAAKILKITDNNSSSSVRASIAETLSHFYCVTQTGNIVHIAFPAGHDVYSFHLGKNLPAFFQIDVVIVENAASVIQHHEHEYTDVSKYTGYDKIAAIASLANSVPGYPDRSFKYSAFDGTVTNRTSGQVVASDLNSVAKLLLGEKYSSKDLRSVDSIVKIVGLNSSRLVQFRAECAAQAK